MKSFLSEFSFYFIYTQTNFRHVFFFFFFFGPPNIFWSQKNYFELYQVFMCWIASNIFWWIFWDKKSFELYQIFKHNFLCQNDEIFTNIFELYSVFRKCFNTSKLYATDALKALLSKNRFCFFFLILRYEKIQPFSRMPRYWH